MPSHDDDYLSQSIKALLQEKLWLLEDRFKQMRMSTHYKTLTNAESRILATLRGEPLTISEVARRLDVSRQAVHKIVTNLVKAQLLRLEPLLDNDRDKRIVFTPEGEQMKRAAGKFLRELDLEIEAAIGVDNFKILQSLLSKKWLSFHKLG